MKKHLSESARVLRCMALGAAFVSIPALYPHAATAAGIQMLPPLEGVAPAQEINTPCRSNEGNKVLTWDGVNPIACNPGFVVDQSGDVGIGTLTPAARLDLTAPIGANGLVSAAALHIYYGNFGNLPGGNDGGNIWLGTGGDFVFDGGTDSKFWFMNSGAASGATAFWSQGNPNLYIENSGNIGLGTQNPLSALHVVASPLNNNMTGILVESPSTQLGSPRIGFVDTALGADTAAPAWYIDNLQDNFRIFRQPNIFTAGWTAMTINNQGFVGIGTPNPVASLDIGGDPAYMHIAGTCGTPPNLTSQGAYFSWNVLGCDLGETDFINNQGQGPGGFAFILANRQGALQNTPMVINGIGNVGIGNTNPSYKLDVSGQARFTGNYTTSDRRLKTNIVDISYGLDTVMKLHPVFFDWKKPVQGEDGRRVGFIAQEVEEVIPEVVTTAPDEMKTKAVEYGNVTPVLVKAIQQLKADNDSLRAEFEAYRKAHP